MPTGVPEQPVGTRSASKNTMSDPACREIKVIFSRGA
jgi:hypothetical protein